MPKNTGGTSKRHKAQIGPIKTGGNGKIDNSSRWRQQKPSEGNTKEKEFGLDTNVLLDDPECFWAFGPQKDLRVGLVVLMEIDSMKKGVGERHRNARRVVEILDHLTQTVPLEKICEGIPLVRPGEDRREAKKRGKLYLDVPEAGKQREWLNPERYPDHKILLGHLERKERLQSSKAGKQFEIISEDRMVRVLARLLGITARRREKIAINIENLSLTGLHELPISFWEKQVQDNLVLGHTEKDNRTIYHLKGAEFEKIALYEFLSIGTPKDKNHLVLQVIERVSPRAVNAITVTDYRKKPVYGLHAKNLEQSLAFNAMLYPGMQLVVLEARTGTGKTLISLAAALELFARGDIDEIVTTRVPVPLTRHELGYAPGTITEKMGNWMLGTTDNFGLLQENYDKELDTCQKKEGKGKKDSKQEKLEDIIKFVDINMLRGSSSMRKFIIIDEAQNSDEGLMKALITRVGLGSIMVFCGNFRQMDMPMPVSSSGLARVIDMIHEVGEKKGIISSHLTLTKIERGNLPAVAEEYFR